MPLFSIKILADKNDLFEFAKIHNEKMRVWLVFYMLCLIILVSIRKSYLLCFILISLLLAYLVVKSPYFIKRRINNELQSNKLFGKETEYKFDESGVSTSNENGYNKVAWVDIYMVKESNRLFLFYMSKNLAFILPKRFFSSDSDLKKLQNIISLNLVADKIKKYV